jgi:hypothetical protein
MQTLSILPEPSSASASTSSAVVVNEIASPTSASSFVPVQTGPITIKVKNQAGVELYVSTPFAQMHMLTMQPNFNDFESDEANPVASFSKVPEQERRVLAVVRPVQQAAPAKADSDEKTGYNANASGPFVASDTVPADSKCSISGDSRGKAGATLVTHLDYPSLRIAKTASSGTLQTSCILEQHRLYVKYVVPEGLQRLKWVSSIWRRDRHLLPTGK